jgi:hypothetical protein
MFWMGCKLVKSINSLIMFYNILFLPSRWMFLPLNVGTFFLDKKKITYIFHVFSFKGDNCILLETKSSIFSMIFSLTMDFFFPTKTIHPYFPLFFLNHGQLFFAQEKVIHNFHVIFLWHA